MGENLWFFVGSFLLKRVFISNGMFVFSVRTFIHAYQTGGVAHVALQMWLAQPHSQPEQRSLKRHQKISIKSMTSWWLNQPI